MSMNFPISPPPFYPLLAYPLLTTRRIFLMSPAQLASLVS